MPIASRAAHIAEGDADRRLRVARLHAQIQIDQGPAAVAGDHKPGMLCRDRGGNLRPEPCGAFCRKLGVEAADGRKGVAFVSPRVFDPPSLKWSDLKYDFGIKEDRYAEETLQA